MMANRRRLTDEQRAEIVRLMRVHRDTATKKIAVMFGVSESTCANLFYGRLDAKRKRLR
jgi:hypothetical protein